jgi:large subunit ribosomal protein L21
MIRMINFIMFWPDFLQETLTARTFSAIIFTQKKNSKERMRYAIIETGSKQYKVQPGDILDVELLQKDGKHLEAGATYAFDNVLLVKDESSATIGAPSISNCKVTAEVLGKAIGPKVIAFKYRACKNYKRKVGHRQKYSRVRINEITMA